MDQPHPHMPVRLHRLQLKVGRRFQGPGNTCKCDIRALFPHASTPIACPPLGMNATLSPTASPKVRRKASQRRPRAASHLPAYHQTPEAHEAALTGIRNFLKGRISYDAFPISFRIIVLDTKLEVKKALQCLLNNGAQAGCHHTHSPGAERTSHLRRSCLGAPVEQREIMFCRDADRAGYHPSHPMVLPHLDLR